MRPIELRLTTPRGDELGRLLLSEVAVAGPGETGATPVRLDDSLNGLYDRVRAVVAAEGMAIALDEIEVQIAVSRALLGEDDGEAVQVSLPVREADPPLPEPDDAGDPPLPEPEAETGNEPFDLDDLFNLDDPTEGEDTGV